MNVTAEAKSGSRQEPIGMVAWRIVASHPSYAQAQRAVDHLSDVSFPVERTTIVGQGLSLVERVTGRLTNTQATLMGASGGAWSGLFIGIFFGLFTTGPTWPSLILAGLVIGAAWGAICGFAADWPTHGERDFASTSRLVAVRYDQVVDDPSVQRARQLLTHLG